MSSDPALTSHTLDSAALIAGLRPALVSFFRRRCSNAAEAEDLAQDVIVKALSQSSWTSADQAKGYIFRSAINRWRDRGRRQVSRGVVVEWSDSATAIVAGEEISLERVLIVEDELLRVSAALQELNTRTREIFMLHRLEQKTYAQIAAAFLISVSAVEKHMIKALAHLARRLGERDDG